VGLTPRAPMLEAGRYFLRKQGKSAGVPERELVEVAVRSMGLDQVAPFDPAKKIIEYHFAPAAPLMSLSAARFVDEVSTESPAPGGGSVAALMGSLGAALATMVANMTVGKKGYEAAWDALAALAERGQALKDQLTRAVDEDTDAFNRVMEAMRLPKATPDQQAQRSRAIEAANKAAADVPLQTARLCLDAIALAATAADLGNRNSVSDAGVAAIAARAGVEGALLNVRINLGGIADAAFKARAADAAAALEADARRACDAVQSRVAGVIAG
jgi:glutamate formiminotransferase / formiminotetrahydrofolate cyclodeaminase